jgi:hypothetical protein
MTFTTMLILNVVLDVAILGGLAFVMSRAAKLTPHRPSLSTARAGRERVRRQHTRRDQRAPAALRLTTD